MPITIYTQSNLKKLIKSDLRVHIVELYGFIDTFDMKKIQIENEKLKEENKEIKALKEENKKLNDILIKIDDMITKIK